ncbi:hypothetical protein C8046_13990 [Serinibacter arcticus]|uniref:Uncharacterized protein n=1 Tax=Serinibacter arcticus TaxID=1655435 RepID=A0A2U1ZX83_9MICO|nr:hypothetical protein [Serinibacter arcticus]PWD51589.1 hypothetical protein C8046_13990 [Serinibacter arcticus]
MVGERRPVRTAALAAGSLLAVAALVWTTGHESWATWSQGRPLSAAPVEADGSAEVAGITVAFEGVELLGGGLVSRFDDAFEAPEGWELWRASFEVSGVPEEDSPEEEAWEAVGATMHVDASDGRTYTRSDVIPSSVEPDNGWLDPYSLEGGAQTDVVLLPDGVVPQRVRLLPTAETSRYWSFEVDAEEGAGADGG